jgi:hypothetical protein
MKRSDKKEIAEAEAMKRPMKRGSKRGKRKAVRY